MMPFLIATGAGILAALLILVAVEIRFQRRKRRARDEFMFRKDHWGM